MQGEFTGKRDKNDQKVPLVFTGEITRRDDNELVKSNFKIKVDFTIEGVSPLSAKEEKNSDFAQDSDARFFDVHGSVQILLPAGYDDNGEPIFEDEDSWNIAKLDTFCLMEQK